MSRAKLVRRSRIEETRQGSLSLWLVHTYTKGCRALRLEVQAKARQRRVNEGTM